MSASDPSDAEVMQDAGNLAKRIIYTLEKTGLALVVRPAMTEDYLARLFVTAVENGIAIGRKMQKEDEER